LRAAWRTDRWAVLWRDSELLEQLWGVSRPDVIYDLGAPPEALEANGYVVAYRQSGELWARSSLFHGGRVSADAWIAVRADHRAAIESEHDSSAVASSNGEEVSGRWRRLRSNRLDSTLSSDQRDEIARLEAIGYRSGSTRASGRSGVTRHDASRSYHGANFYTSGHEPGAILMDMDGNVLHRWKLSVRDAWPDYAENGLHSGVGFWRRAKLFENGDVLAIFEGIGLVKIDVDSKLLWAQPNKAHHDLAVLEDGRIVVLTREARLIPRLDRTKPVLEDFVSYLDPDGNEIRRISLLEAFENSDLDEHWSAGDSLEGDLFHTNSLEVLDGRIAARVPAFAAGNLLLSMLVPDVIAVVDPDSERVVWARKGGAGAFAKQHDPKLLSNGALLLFDNRGVLPHSRVLELDPQHPDEVAWSFTGSPEEPMHSFTCGAAERLPNGNTLITESDGGRAIEVTIEGDVVWEYYNPHRPSDDATLIATLFEMIRLPADFDLGWLDDSSFESNPTLHADHGTGVVLVEANP
jgi:hypothetical protein